MALQDSNSLMLKSLLVLGGGSRHVPNQLPYYLKETTVCLCRRDELSEIVLVTRARRDTVPVCDLQDRRRMPTCCPFPRPL